MEWHHADDEVGRFAETLKTVRETEALACGLEVAVWVWDNKLAAALVEFLRREGPVAAVAESDPHVAMDNSLTVALRAGLRRVAHPGDTPAQEHLIMPPLGGCGGGV